MNTSRALKNCFLLTSLCLLLPITSSMAPRSFAEQDDQLALSQPLIVKWRYPSDRLTNLTPACDDQTIFVPLAGGTVVALLAKTGELRWKTDAGGEFSAPPISDDRNVYVATEYREGVGAQAPFRGTLRAISKDTGVTRWMRTLTAPIRGTLAANALRVFTGTADGRVYAFDKGSGLSVWFNQYAAAFSGQPVVSGERLYLAGDSSTLFALDQATGRTMWRYRTRAAVSSAVAVSEGVVYFGSSDGFVYAVKEAKSKVLWSHRTGASVQAVIVVDNGLIAASLDNFAYLLSPRNGAIVWRQLLPGRIAARPLAAKDGALFTPLSTDSAIVLGLKDGKPVNTLPLGEDNSNSGAAVATQRLVFVTTPHALLAFAPPG